MNGLDDASRNRLRLWLRGEKAFGLKSVPAPAWPQATGTAQLMPAPPVARQSPVNPAPRMAIPGPMRAGQEVDMAKRAPQPAAAPSLIPAPNGPGFDAPLLPRDQRIVRLKLMDDNEVKGCVRCRLHETRTHTVFGEGDPEAKIFFIGEGPGETEDNTGRPFVGKAGQLLDKMIGGMGLKREQVFISNIVKCRPPNNRVPATDEVATCTPYLERQLEIIRPRVIVTLGRPATTYMLSSKLAMGALRGRWHQWRGIKLMPTFHPSYVLRSYTEEVRAAVWSDLKQVLVELEMPVPRRGG